MFDHFVLTRFNVRCGPEVADYPDGCWPGADAAWLRRRMELFARVCVPSMRSQTCRDFRWLVLCDAESPPWLAAELAQFSDVCESVWMPADQWTAPQEVRRRATHDWIITTRLDSDDALAPTFLEQVQRSFDARDTFIVFEAGAALTDSGMVFSRFTSGLWHEAAATAFTSLVEPAAQCGTVFKISQFIALTNHNARRITTTEPMWMLFCHGGNVFNKPHGQRAHPGLLDGFAVDWPRTPISGSALRFHQMRSLMKSAVRVMREPGGVARVRRNWRARLAALR